MDLMDKGRLYLLAAHVHLASVSALAGSRPRGAQPFAAVLPPSAASMTFDDRDDGKDRASALGNAGLSETNGSRFIPGGEVHMQIIMG